MTRALIYARCSTTEQDYSRQIEELRRIAASKGWTITGEFGSYVSGGANDSDLNEIRSLASRRKIDALMVWELSRLSRKGPLAILGLLAQLEKEGVMVYSYSETWLNVEGPARGAPYRDLRLGYEMGTGHDLGQDPVRDGLPESTGASHGASERIQGPQAAGTTH